MEESLDQESTVQNKPKSKFKMRGIVSYLFIYIWYNVILIFGKITAFNAIGELKQYPTDLLTLSVKVLIFLAALFVIYYIIFVYIRAIASENLIWPYSLGWVILFIILNSQYVIVDGVPIEYDYRVHYIIDIISLIYMYSIAWWLPKRNNR